MEQSLQPPPSLAATFESASKFKYLLTRKGNGLPENRNIWVICQPKTGSTMLCNILSTILYINILDSTYFHPRRYEFDPLKYLHIKPKQLIHIHARPNIYLSTAIELEKCRPITLTREIDEIVISLINHSINSNIQATNERASNIGHLDYRKLDKRDAIDFVISRWGMWLSEFQKQWRSRKFSDSAIYVSYDDLSSLERAIKTTSSILRKLGHDTNIDVIENACESVFNDSTKSNKTPERHFTKNDLTEEHLKTLGVIQKYSSY